MSSTKIRTLVEPEFSVDEYFLRQASIDEEKYKIRKRLGMTVRKKPKGEKLNFYEDLKIRIYKAGLEYEPLAIVRWMFYATLVLLAATSIILAGITIANDVPVGFILLYLIVWWALGFAFLYSLVVVAVKTALDYRIFKRRLEVERVLPEYLRLVATNYRSGMPLDKAMIKSNRARFGVFSKEISLVAKVSKVKGDLVKALTIFSKKFDSKILTRAVNNINLSIDSGSDISRLLDDISTNIIRMRNMRKSMAANVKNYVIFIIVAGVIIAPLMFSMSYQMNDTVKGIQSKFATQTKGSGAGSGHVLMQMQGNDEGGILPSHYNIFAILLILTNSVVSSFLISIIRHGNFQQGVKYVPVFVFISIILYFLGKGLFHSLLVIV